MKPISINDDERRTYEWQMWTPDFGEAGQQRLKGASVLISRVGGVGGLVAYELAAAGIGRLVLAHGGDLRSSDLNRQLLMTYAWLGKPRVECAAARLKELNPQLVVDAVAENISEGNAARLVGSVDVVIDCAPRFEERLLMNREAFRQGKPLIECAMYDFEAQITTLIPGRTPCLACLYPNRPDVWKREFPVFGAVAGFIGCLGAIEAIKLISGIGEPLLSKLLICDLRAMTFRTVSLELRPGCSVCQGQ